MCSATPPVDAVADESYPELARWLSGVASIAEAVNSSGPVEQLLDRVAETACTLMGYDFCGVFLPNAHGDALVIEGASGLSRSYIDQVNADHPVRLVSNEPGEAPSSRAFLSGRSVAIEDITIEPLFRPWGGVAREQGYRSMVSVPLRTADAIVGTLNCYRAGVHHFGQAELGLLTTLANQAAIAIGTARLREREARRISELQGLNRSLEAQQSVLQKAEAIHKRMTSVALRGEGVQGVARALGQLIGVPVVIDDAQGAMIAASSDADPDNARMPRSYRDPSGIGEDTSSLLELFPGGPDQPTVVVAPVKLEEVVVARIWVPTRLSDLGPLDARAIEHATVVAALELLRERTAAEVEWRMRGSLVADLLSDDAAISHSTRERAARLGHNLSVPHVILVGSVGSEVGADGGSPALESVLGTTHRYAARFCPLPMVAIHRGYVVALWPLSSADSIEAENSLAEARAAAEYIRQALKAGDPTRSATVAMSPICEGAADYARAFRVALGAVELVRLGDDSDRTVSPDDLGIDSLLLQLDNPAQLLDFANRVLGPLYDYDGTRGTELLLTLQVFLDEDLQSTATARALHVHPNTVSQRLRRIEGLLGVRLGRPTDLLNLSAALAVERIVRPHRHRSD